MVSWGMDEDSMLSDGTSWSRCYLLHPKPWGDPVTSLLCPSLPRSRSLRSQHMKSASSAFQKSPVCPADRAAHVGPSQLVEKGRWAGRPLQDSCDAICADGFGMLC